MTSGGLWRGKLIFFLGGQGFGPQHHVQTGDSGRHNAIWQIFGRERSLLVYQVSCLEYLAPLPFVARIQTRVAVRYL